ncbi:MAG: PadR family transcriptional regulator [Dehalococcoidales bacterium]
MFKRMFESERQSRLFAKGDIKYVILNLLKDKPSYGYEIMHSLEEHFHGFYSPSAGSVYPTLQMLGDLGYVIASERDGKKIFTISEEGKRFLEDNKPIITRIKLHMHDWQEDSGREELRDVFHEMRRLVRLISRKTRSLDRTKLKKINEIMAQAYHHVEDVVDEE